MISNKKIALGLCSLLLAPLLATAASKPGKGPTGPDPTTEPVTEVVTSGTSTPRRVPEIDASSGTQAFALLVGALILSAEYIRRRRPAKGL